MNKLTLCILIFIVAACNGQKKIFTPDTANIKSLQLLKVVVPESNSTKGTMKLYEREDRNSSWKIIDSFPVTIGKNGLANDGYLFPDSEIIKKEGDGCSPSGIFFLGKVFSYHDMQLINMPFEQVDENDLCVDDVNSKYYNLMIDDDTIVTKDYTSFERMQRKDMQYEYGVWINYNESSNSGKLPTPGMGSCIFLHVWKDADHPTSGCTAMSKENMLKIIYWLDEKKSPGLVQYVESK